MLASTSIRLDSLLFSCALMTICSLTTPTTVGSQELRIIPREGSRPFSDDEIRYFVSTALDTGLPTQLIGQVYLVSRKRSEVVVPELTSALYRTLYDTFVDSVWVRKIADVLAYVADERAMDEPIRLGVLDHNQFGYFISRALDYAQGVRNPYALAYHGFRRHNGDSRTDEDIVRWVKASAFRAAGYRLWAAAIVERAERRKERLVSALALSNDLLIGRIGSGPPEGLVREVEVLLAAKSRPQ